MQGIITLSLYAVSILTCGLLFMVLRNNKQNTQASRVFSFIVLSALVWIATNFATSLSTIFIPTQSLLFAKLTLIGPSFIPSLLVLFASTYPNKKLARTHSLLFLPTALLLASIPTSLNLLSAKPNRQLYAVEIQPGWAYTFLILFFLLYSAIALTKLLKTRAQSTSGIMRSQIALIINGYVATVTIAVILAAILPLFGKPGLAHLAPLSTLIFIGSTVYAITTYKLFDVRVFISKAIIYTSLLGITMATYGFAVMLLSGRFSEISSNGHALASIVTLTILSLSFDPIRNGIAEYTDSWLYKKEYEQQEVTRRLSEKLGNVIGLDEGLDVVMHELTETLHINQAVTYVFQVGEFKKQTLKHSRYIGVADPRSLELTEKDFIIYYFTELETRTITLEDLEHELVAEEDMISHNRYPDDGRSPSLIIRQHSIKKAVAEKLRDLDCAVAIPLHLHLKQES